MRQWRSQGFDPGGQKIFFGAPHVRKFFDDLFLLLPPISPPAPPAGGRRTSRTRGAIPSGKGARGARCPPAPPPLGSATAMR
jgi:hypothetical protein